MIDQNGTGAPVSARRSFRNFLLPSLVVGAGSFIVTPIITYYLNPRDFGIFAILNAVFMPVGAVASVGSTIVYTAHYLSISTEDRRVLLFNLLAFEFALRLFWATLAFAAAPTILPLVVRDFESPFAWYFRVLVVAFLANAVWAVLSGYLVLHKESAVHARFEVAQWSVGIAGTLVGLAVFHLGTAALFVGPLIGNTVAACIGLWYLRSRLILRLDWHWIREAWRTGIPSVASTLFESLSNAVDRYFIQRWTNLTQLGLYGFSQNFRSVFTMGMKAFNRTYIPHYHELVGSMGSSDRVVRMLRTWYGVIGVVGVGVALFSRDVIVFLTHGKFVDAAPFVTIWFLFVVSMTFGTSYVQELMLRNRMVTIARVRIGIGSLFLLLTALAVWRYGPMGAAVAMLTMNMTIQLAFRVYARRLGCTPIGEREFLVVTVTILSVFLVANAVAIPFLVRCIVFLAVGWGLASWTGLPAYARAVLRSFMPGDQRIA